MTDPSGRTSADKYLGHLLLPYLCPCPRPRTLFCSVAKKLCDKMRTTTKIGKAQLVCHEISKYLAIFGYSFNKIILLKLLPFLLLKQQKFPENASFMLPNTSGAKFTSWLIYFSFLASLFGRLSRAAVARPTPPETAERAKRSVVKTVLPGNLSGSVSRFCFFNVYF